MSKKFVLTAPELINKSHNKKDFDCGNEHLNIFLKNYALQNDKNNSSRTYVSIERSTEKIIGYYTLTYGSIAYAEATEEVNFEDHYTFKVSTLAGIFAIP